MSTNYIVENLLKTKYMKTFYCQIQLSVPLMLELEIKIHIVPFIVVYGAVVFQAC